MSSYYDKERESSRVWPGRRASPTNPTIAVVVTRPATPASESRPLTACWPSNAEIIGFGCSHTLPKRYD